MLLARTVTGFLGAALLLACVVLGHWYFLLFVGLIFLAGHGEFMSMRKQKRDVVSLTVTALFGLILLFWNTSFGGGVWSAFHGLDALLWPLLILLAWTVFSNNRYTYEHLAFDFCSALFLGLGLHYVLLIRFLPFNGFYWFLLFLLGIWATDIGAYFVGRWIGGPKLCPGISPNKTISGAIGGLLVALAFTLCYSWLLYTELRTHWIAIALITVGTSMFGQLGDLVESALKRTMGVKDSGTLLPGHGGILDRFDSLIFAAPVAYHLIVWTSQMR